MGGYEDWPAFMRRAGSARGLAPGAGSRARLSAALGVPSPGAAPAPERVASTKHDGVTVTELRWQLAFGPATRAFLLTPEDATGPLPGVLWLSCHGGRKHLGAERLLDRGPETSGPARDVQDTLYGGRAVANELARRGFAVLVHDAFSWGSRRFGLDPAPWRTAEAVDGRRARWAADGHRPTAEEVYDAAAADHENTIAKAALMLGTSYAGMVAHDDLAALGVLRSLPEADPDRLGCAGFSGGGGRSLVLAALVPAVRAAVVCAMMTTTASLFPAHVDAHSWLLAGPFGGLEFPELATMGRARLLVQFAARDPLFPPAGMRDAERMLLELAPGRAATSWHDTEHEMGLVAQEEAFGFLADSLRRDDEIDTKVSPATETA
ncbi:dienelactone hydrolase family protein [Specibacter cremeus]|uniref:dienelactone hydrolase family protein n=1 Tax=Specibacter cremeus TaxID=1629051 RepID=UPI001F0BD834|nr:dienelactone hydrolase family protein [Specibacter cremeus]